LISSSISWWSTVNASGISISKHLMKGIGRLWLDSCWMNASWWWSTTQRIFPSIDSRFHVDESIRLHIGELTF
jgi:hypothetical protein